MRVTDASAFTVMPCARTFYSVCPVLKRKIAKSLKATSGVCLIKSVSISGMTSELDANPKVDDCFLPFILNGFVSLTGEEKDKVSVTILRDTGAYQSFLLESVLPLSEQIYCGSDILVWGIKISVLRAPSARGICDGTRKSSCASEVAN